MKINIEKLKETLTESIEEMKSYENKIADIYDELRLSESEKERLCAEYDAIVTARSNLEFALEAVEELRA